MFVSTKKKSTFIHHNNEQISFLPHQSNDHFLFSVHVRVNLHSFIQEEERRREREKWKKLEKHFN